MSNSMILVIAEHDHKTLKSSTLNAVIAAQQIAAAESANIQLLVVGYQCQAAAEMGRSIAGVSQVLVCDAAHYASQLAEEVTEAIVPLATGFSHIIFPATSYGKNIAPRLAATLDVAQISDITQVCDAQTFVRPIYAGNALETVQNNGHQLVISVRCSAFSPAKYSEQNAPIKSVNGAAVFGVSQHISQSLTPFSRPELTTSKIVISGGRGLSSKENFQLIEKIADQLGAAIGASRAAVDAGYVPNDYQVGQTGKIIAPDLYIAVGISGAIQHIAGMKESKLIVAINKDKDAPIFQIADYGIVGDLFQILPELEKALV
ncbi:electron transfer flavoprotein subunit alpha/FixB family protein [Pragia fontium]|uniref:Electron transfer flavoprotein subunit alpha n=1 Tax=Pragia fontium DSM 5563 = ATCC 49100 TaxID=1122977 RepID=A0AAJ4W8C1_9GAMM|nr:FAD-binding protein [Pragia fontium]SFC07817.1 electron transfer flavoprotein alpha subunit apoprotein [Pragia fontium DSM 5563 = ATCC 49100]